MHSVRILGIKACYESLTYSLRYPAHKTRERARVSIKFKWINRILGLYCVFYSGIIAIKTD